MAKKQSAAASNSSLSPPPNDVLPPIESAATKNLVSRQKRKAETVPKITKRAKQVQPQNLKKENATAGGGDISTQPKKRATKKTIVEVEKVEISAEATGDQSSKIVVKKSTTRKTKSVKKGEPLQERTQNTKLCIGAHVSSAGGVQNSITNLIHIGANAFALFLKNQKRWESKDLDPEHARLFIEGCKEHDIHAADCCVPHGSYLVNLAHPDPERKKQAYDSFLNDLTRCQRLGIKLYNFHPGNANATTHDEGIRLIAENLNKAHQNPATGNVVTLLETMATVGNTIGGTFADIAAIIGLVKDKSRVGVCLDTCHIFAAGYDIRTPEAYASTMEQFDQEIGLKYLKAFHINDSKAPLSSHRDLHARIGTGYLRLGAFHNIMNDERFHGIPMILETPVSVDGEDGEKIEGNGTWAREIKMLEKLVGMDIDADEFKELDAKLQEEGKGERERIGAQVERSKAKNATPKKKGRKKVESEDQDQDQDEDEDEDDA